VRWWARLLANREFSHFITLVLTRMDYYIKMSRVTNVTWPFLTHPKVIQPSPMKIMLGPAFFWFYHILSRHYHPVVTKSQDCKAPYKILSINSFITELISPLTHHNSRDASTKPLQHLISIGDLKYQEVTWSEVESENGNPFVGLYMCISGDLAAWYILHVVFLFILNFHLV
jgi:hypothetical protein